MAGWGVAQAKAQFSAVLDKAETEGPQLLKRRKREFYIVTKEQLAEAKACSQRQTFRQRLGRVAALVQGPI